jgi:hypothetical protein
MTKHYVVVDLNVLGRGKIKDLLANQPNTRFVLPDLSFLEMTKSDRWESVLRHTLQPLAQHTNKVFVCRSVSDGLAAELANLRPVSKHMLHREATHFVRDLLNWVGSGNEGYAVALIRKDPECHRVSLAADYLDHRRNKMRLKELIEDMQRILPGELQKRMRSANISEDERVQYIHDVALLMLPQVLGTSGISIGKARAFMRHKPLVLRYMFLKIWHCTFWIEKGGFDTFPEAKITNDEIDQQYVLAATFFDGLESLETKVNQSYQDLKLLLAKKIQFP